MPRYDSLADRVQEQGSSLYCAWRNVVSTPGRLQCDGISLVVESDTLVHRGVDDLDVVSRRVSPIYYEGTVTEVDGICESKQLKFTQL